MSPAHGAVCAENFSRARLVRIALVNNAVALGQIHSHYDINLFSADGIRIPWGPSAFNVGIDNIDFSNAVS